MLNKSYVELRTIWNLYVSNFYDFSMVSLWFNENYLLLKVQIYSLLLTTVNFTNSKIE